MKRSLSNLILLIPLLILFPYSNILAGNQVTEKQALDTLEEQIKKDKLYDNRLTFSCLLFITEETTENYFDFAVHEKHGGECQGDPNTSPIVDRFRINRITKEIQWYDVVEDGFVPYGTMLSARNDEMP
jgi:hypothetical protein